MGSHNHAEAFHMACPKCANRTTYSVTRVPGTYTSGSRGNEWENLVFSCTCGKQLYGLAIKEEYDEQLRVSRQEAKASQKAEEAARSEAARAAAEARARADAERRRREEEERRRVQKSTVCAWKACGKKARPNSIYCSRTCNNKNARWRYKQRLRGNL